MKLGNDLIRTMCCRRQLHYCTDILPIETMQPFVVLFAKDYRSSLTGLLTLHDRGPRTFGQRNSGSPNNLYLTILPKLIPLLIGPHPNTRNAGTGDWALRNTSENLAAESSTQPSVNPCGTPTCYVTVDHLGSTRLITDA